MYADNDVSASGGKPRPQYQRLLQDMRDGLIDVVLVWHTDRLHRQPAELETFISIAESRQQPVSVHAVQAGPLDLATPSGRMVARMLGAAARYEVELKGERSRASNRQAAEQGKPRGGGRPFGFETDKITHRPVEAAAIRQAVDAVLAGDSLHEVARQWNARGLLTTTGNAWVPTTVRQVLKRPRTAGLREYRAVDRSKASGRRSEIVGKGVWEPIVDEESWRAMVTLLDDPARRSGPGNKPRWLLSGLALCGVDGCPFTMKIALASHASSGGTAPNRHVYRCRGGGHLSRSAADVDEFVTMTVLARLERPDAVTLLDQETNVDLAALHAEARTLRARAEALALQAATGDITPEQMVLINRSVQSRLREIESQTAVTTHSNALAGLVARPDVEQRWQELSLTRRRGVVDTLMTVTVRPVGKGASFTPAGVDIAWKTPGNAPVACQRGNVAKPLASA